MDFKTDAWKAANFIGYSKCPKCGRGVNNGYTTHPCLCDRKGDLDRNSEKFIEWMGADFKTHMTPLEQSIVNKIHDDPHQYYRIRCDEKNIKSIALRMMIAFCKGLANNIDTYKLVSDKRLLQTWLTQGEDDDFINEKRDKQSIYNLLNVGKQGILIVQVGIQSSKNSEAKTVLFENIYERVQNKLPVWIWESSTFCKGSVAWSEEFENLMDNKFSFIDFKQTLPNNINIVTKPKIIKDRKRVEDDDSGGISIGQGLSPYGKKKRPKRHESGGLIVEDISDE